MKSTNSSKTSKTSESDDCLCKNAKAFEHEVRKIAGQIITDRRRYLLSDFRGVILEGKVHYQEGPNGTVTCTIDYSDVASLLKHSYKEGESVRLVAIPVGKESEFDRNRKEPSD